MASEHTNWLISALNGAKRARVAVFGDFCLDAYWVIDSGKGDLSVETGLPVRRVRTQHYSLGGAGNVVANLAALSVGAIHVVGLVGDDIFGWKMRKMLGDLEVDTRGLVNCQSDWQTVVYGKPCIGDEEQNRLDFGALNVISTASIKRLARELRRVVAEVDIVILNQQSPAGVSTPEMIEEINAVIGCHPGCRFIVDSRHHSERYRGAMLKMNVHEAARVAGEPRPLEACVTAGDARRFAVEIFRRMSHPVFVTRGENGMVVADGGQLEEVPGILTIDRVDPVGAGDTTVAALAAVLGGGGNTATAATVVNIAAFVTVRKLQTTGTATRQEILQVGPQPDYVYLPELADDPRGARYVKGAEIEIVRDLPDGMRIRHAIFDHDGTISTLRQGWEQIMEPMMIRAILGPRYADADKALYRKAVSAVRRFIDRTTGIQTLAQMKMLVRLVEQFSCVARQDILDMHGYKAVYNEALQDMVRGRVAKLHRSELNPEDFQIKGAQYLIETLHARGVRLYLASGTDQSDVVSEAETLGYAHFFEGGIFGAVGKVEVEAKRMVMDRIVRENGLDGLGLVTFGDGPVEMRACRKLGAVAVGIASDEVRRFGLNPAKRARLIRAGADLIVPDFSQSNVLLSMLGIAE